MVLKSDDISNLILERWNTFEQFKNRAFKLWIVSIPIDGTQWKTGSCTCPCYLKKYMCKHLVGVALRRKYVKAPPSAKDIPIGEKRKRGRPKKSTKALLTQ